MVKIDIPMLKQCHGCRFFWFKGATCGNPGHYLDARCALSDRHNDWYKKDIHGGWIGEDIDPQNQKGYYSYHHAVKIGTRAKDCPLREVKQDADADRAVSS